MNAPLALSTPRPARLTVKDFLALERIGAFREYSRSELIDGTIYVVNSQYTRHMRVKTHLLVRLALACAALPAGYEAWSDGSVELDEHSLPEPDLLVTNCTPMGKFVIAKELVLAIEVSNSTAAFDLGKKAKVYAKSGLPEYWVFDLRRERIFRHVDPAPDGYARRDELALGERLSALTLPGLSVETFGLD